MTVEVDWTRLSGGHVALHEAEAGAALALAGETELVRTGVADLMQPKCHAKRGFQPLVDHRT
jgi:hypothetical protein